ncbi:cytochrome ubiquinol oxidase subunit I [Rhizobium leguminosarum]|uniref:cytochrome ubiquinol oxidase subunit I n=1 Tax=Rhizobium leguminosarum TaxID=384 RepID=UPI00102F436F|nr:cytochrome ubiquinol oxidase subunit I [Rhizobium leguminosarum]TAU16491.1 cytochrome ubiquinol oxidase subunit I [Rhizobium leguminosarum]TAU34814.1 cytochrome ubiquinol oxidase subunit I [Rhizobium leguminosarum]TAX44008.1 cytochrome ubiquinol oxidase subunit I [Rhizobium leguminosarum]TAZ49203.1 cytochrome ubiquinol oxidase subunit I [Rhizobium leguminosarum]WSH74454.1 cytochrome ubiquinol oxidase subunit I [Rhizobium leguminosarum]
MEITALFLSRLQFAATISFHIIFPAFTIGLAAYLCYLEGMSLKTGMTVYRRLFEFWLRVFAIAFGIGVVTGIVMAFQFGTNWSELSRRTGSIQGPLLGYESFTAFALEASFFGVLMFGRKKVRPAFYFFACLMVALGTTMSAFWIMVNNSWMQWPVGFIVRSDGVYEPTDWAAIVFSPVAWVRFPHMLLAAYLTTAFCVAATGAWHLLRGRFKSEARVMLRTGLGLAALLVPLQLGVGHLTGDYVHDKQPAKFAAIEGRWNDEQPATEVLVAWPDEETEQNYYQVGIPYLGSVIGSMSFSSKEIGLKSIPVQNRPPVLIPFFAFRIMVACGFLMLFLSWVGTAYAWGGRVEGQRWLLWMIFYSFPVGFIATLSGWFTAEVGRQPWTVFGLLRTTDAATPFLQRFEVAFSLALFGVVYSILFIFGSVYIYVLLKRGPVQGLKSDVAIGNPKRPLSESSDVALTVEREHVS